jgi:hypothetical protein
VNIAPRNYVNSFPKHKEKRGKIVSNKKQANEMTPFPARLKTVNVCRGTVYVQFVVKIHAFKMKEIHTLYFVHLERRIACVIAHRV